MADGELTLSPPPHEVGVFTPLNTSTSLPKPLSASIPGHRQHLLSPIAAISKAQSLEEGEISPLLASVVPPVSNKPIHLISFSNVVQGHKQALPVSEVSSVDPTSLCLDSLPLKPLSIFEGKPCVRFTSSEKRSLISNHKFVLVGKFSHGRPPLSSIKVFFAALKLQGRYNLSIFDNKHLFIEIDLKIDYVRIWLKLNWSIAGFVMRIFKWGSDFTPVKESTIAPVWIRIEAVPLYLFDKLSLMSIANAIGQPLSVHPLNVNRVKLNSALICVELDVSIPLMDSIYVCFEDDISLRPVDGIWLKVFYDVVPLYCSSCLHIGHHVDVCKKGKSVLLAVASKSAGQLGSVSTAPQVFDGNSQPAASAPAARVATAQRIEKSSSAAQKLVQDVPSCSYTALNTHHQHKRGNQSQVWIASKGSGTWKSQLQLSNYKDKALSIDNSFSALEVEQKSATFQELKSDLQKVLQVDNLQLSEAAFGADSSVETVVESSAMLQEIAVAAADVEHSVQQNLKTQPTNSTVQLQNTTMSSEPPSQLVGPLQAECYSGLVEVLPAPVTPYKPHSEVLHKVVTGADLVAAIDPPSLGLEPVPVSATKKGEIHQFVPTVENPSSKLVKGVDELETIKDLNTADNKANRADTKRYISKDDSQIDDIQYDYGNPLTALPLENYKCFMDSKGNQIEIHECKEAGYRHIARRSLSPPGRSSPKLISLRQKVEHACEKRSSLRDSKVYSEEFLALVEQTRSAMNSSPRDKLPTPTGPGQSRQRRNRGRNRYSYGTPDQPPRYRGQGYH